MLQEGVSRNAIVVCKPDHEIWSISTPQEMKSYLQRRFPQLTPLENYVSDEVMAST